MTFAKKDDGPGTSYPPTIGGIVSPFDGPVRLLHTSHTILAANPIAIEKGFLPGICCAKVKEPCSHKGCKSALMLKTGSAQYDRPEAARIRGWIPIQGYDNIYVHYTIQIPEED